MIDFLRVTRWTGFFEVFGKNPLSIYLLSELGVVLLFVFPDPDSPAYSGLYDHVFQHAGLYFGSFLFAVCWMLTCWLVGWLLDKRKIYIRV
jgi:predicted acyltransferase